MDKKTDFIKDFPNYAETLFREKNQDFAKIKINGYQELGYKILSIINICRASLDNDSEVDSLELSRVLGIAGDLLPLSEFKFLEDVANAGNN